MKPFFFKPHFFLALTLALGLSAPAAHAATVLVLSSDEPSVRATAEGFKKAFPGDYREYNLQGNEEAVRRVGAELEAARPELTVVIGDLAAQMAKWYLHDAPLIYCEAGYAKKISLTSSHAVGIYHETDPLAQLAAIRELFPGRKRIGLLIAPAYSPVDLKPIQEKAQAQGLTLEIAAMNSIKDVPTAFREIAPKVDLFWVFTDPVVLNSLSMQYIVLQALSSGQPLFGGDAKLARSGATAALVPDARDVGAQAAAKAQELLKAPAAPAPGTVLYPKGNLVLNQKTAALMKISFPSALLKQAQEIIQ